MYILLGERWRVAIHRPVYAGQKQNLHNLEAYLIEKLRPPMNIRYRKDSDHPDLIKKYRLEDMMDWASWSSEIEIEDEICSFLNKR